MAHVKNRRILSGGEMHDDIVSYWATKRGTTVNDLRRMERMWFLKKRIFAVCVGYLVLCAAYIVLWFAGIVPHTLEPGSARIWTTVILVAIGVLTAIVLEIPLRKRLETGLYETFRKEWTNLLEKSFVRHPDESGDVATLNSSILKESVGSQLRVLSVLIRTESEKMDNMQSDRKRRAMSATYFLRANDRFDDIHELASRFVAMDPKGSYFETVRI